MAIRAIDKAQRAEKLREERKEQRPDRRNAARRDVDGGDQWQRRPKADGAADGRGGGSWWESRTDHPRQPWGGQPQESAPDAATYEQQVRDGFRPVYQGDRIVAMVRENEAVKPGRRAEFPTADRGKGEEKGKGRGDDTWQRSDRYAEDGKGKGRRSDPPQRPQLRWRVSPGENAIVREQCPVESSAVGTLNAGTLVAQLGEDKVLPNGIVRMQVEAIEPQAGMQGWVTRTAEAAGGPVFFKSERGPRAPGAGRGRGKGEGKGMGKGRPVGEGEGAY